MGPGLLLCRRSETANYAPRAPAACARLGRGGPEEGQFSPEKTNISTFKKDIILQQAPAYILKVA